MLILWHASLCHTSGEVALCRIETSFIVTSWLAIAGVNAGKMHKTNKGHCRGEAPQALHNNDASDGQSHHVNEKTSMGNAAIRR